MYIAVENNIYINIFLSHNIKSRTLHVENANSNFDYTK